ncbi:premnaspirodiene oxygenase-like [Senna tora]|uniref:Premnaspirodiene oxygenase-like n=1 Tax=Senna tora TaxID=362788 RepID=A0A834WED9_9FABA|nr:premnaspirodiene oxygenase-like [Senna tora]
MNRSSKSSTTSSNLLPLPPGPWKLPLIGSMHHLLFPSGSLPHIRLRDLSQKHGPHLMHIQLCERSTIVASSPEAAREIYKTHDLNFAQRPPSIAGNIVTYGCTGIALSPYGHYWRHIRKLCTMELLSTKRVRSYHSIRQEEVLSLMTFVARNQGSCINLGEKIFHLMYAVISRASFGERFKEQEKVYEVVKAIVVEAGLLGVTDLFPSKKWLQVVSGERRKYEELHRKVDEVLDDIINGVALKVEEGEAEGLLPVLLNLKDQDDLELPLTMDNVKAVILVSIYIYIYAYISVSDIFVGATETSSITIEWAMSELLRNPGAMRRAQEEVREAFRSKGYIDDETSIEKLDYLKAVIKETLRLHPPLPLTAPRVARESCHILGFHIPKGAQVFVNAWAIMRDPNHWAQPERFYPERFLGSGIDFTSPHFHYKPFGSGKRICPGMLFALPNLEVPLAHLLFHFDWELPFGTTPQNLDMSEAFGSSVKKKKDLFVIPTTYAEVPILTTK